MTSMMRAKKSSRVISPRRISLNRVPSLMNSTRLVNEAAKASWVTIMMVAFICVFIISSVSSMICALRESRAPVGSSAKMSLGSDTMARAAAMRCFCPPDIWYGYFFSTPSTPRFFAMASILAGMFAGDSCLMVRASAMFSKPLRVSSRLASWKMKPRSSRRNFASWRFEAPVMSRPPTRMLPPVGNVDGRHAVQKAWSCRNLTVP